VPLGGVFNSLGGFPKVA